MRPSHLITALFALVVAANADRPPNVVIIFTDDQGYQDLGCFGSPDIKTPHIDQMAAEGARYVDFHVAAAVCTPSRAALLTGKYPMRLGLSNKVLFPHSGDRGLDPAEITLADLLKEKGYATACIGKWHLGHADRVLPTAQGFDTYYGVPYSNDMWLAPELNPAENIVLREGLTLETMREMAAPKATKESRWKVPLMRDTKIVEFPADQTTLTKRYAEETARFIAENKDRPFFVYLAPAMPHIPLFASEAFRGKSAAGLYGDTIEEIDWAVGHVNATLQKHGLVDNTLVIFTSDNGPWLSHGDDGGHALPLRNGKGSTFEGGQRVPCVMKMPGLIPAGTTQTIPISALDLLPTIGELAGIPVDHHVDGESALDVLRGDPDAKAPRGFFLYYLHNDTLSAVRQGDWKLIFGAPVIGYSQKVEAKKYAKDQPMKPELYNLREDIGETTNLYDQHPEIAEKLLALAKKEAAKIDARLRQ